MFIDSGGGVAYLQPSSHEVTIALTNPAGSVVLEQRDEANGWFPVVQGGLALTLGPSDTVRSVYTPFKIRVTATGTGVRLYNKNNIVNKT